MKIAIFSDTHLGFEEKGERSEESFENLVQAISLSAKESADAILLGGDVFDAPVPSHNVLYKAMDAFSTNNSPSDVKVFVEKSGVKKQAFFKGIPIIAIHGNHECLGKETRTALDVLCLCGQLVYAHAASVCIEKGGERAFAHCLGSVPEKKALEALQHWNPRPVQGSANIIMTHQGYKEFMAVDDEMVATLSLDDLPAGFDLFVNGHLHWRQEQNLGKGVFLLPGSTISTSIKKLEAEKPKGVYFFDTASKKLSFSPFEKQRKAFYHKIVFEGADALQVAAKCRETVLSDIAGVHELKPLIRLNLKGSLKKGLANSDVNLKEILGEFSQKAILSVSKDFSDLSFRKKISELRELQKSRLSVAAMGFGILEKSLSETDFGKEVSAKELFELLSEDEIDKALALFSKNQ